MNDDDLTNAIENDSICKLSYSSMLEFCNYKCYNLEFLLKESQIIKFKKEYINLIEIYKQFFGEYWSRALKTNAQMLYHLAKTLNLIESAYFILISSNLRTMSSDDDNILDHSYIMTSIELKEINKLEKCIDEDLHDLKKIKQIFKNTPSIKKLLFEEIRFKEGNRVICKPSLFERIIVDSSLTLEIFNYIWEEFQLWDNIHILNAKNFTDLFKYQMNNFLKINSNSQQYMMLKNSIYYNYTGLSLIDYYFKLIDNLKFDEVYESLDSLLYFFEEIEAYNKQEHNRIKNEYIESIISKNLDSEMIQKKFAIGIMLIYWKKIEIQQLNSSPFYNLLFSIIKRNDEDFINTFLTEMYKIDYLNDKGQDNIFCNVEQYSIQLSFVFLYAAIKLESTADIIDLLFEYNTFITICPTFPLNMKPHMYVTLKFLNSRYEIGRADLPKKWISYDLVKKFLNSCIKDDYGYRTIDCRFTLSYYNYDRIRSSKIDLIMNEDYDTIEYIANDQELKSLIDHPVIEQFANIKIRKYKRIIMLDNILFLLFYMFPMLTLLMFRDANLLFSSIRLLYILSREVYLKKYFQKQMNIFQIVIVIVFLFNSFIPVTIAISMEIFNAIWWFFANTDDNANKYVMFAKRIRIFYAIRENNHQLSIGELLTIKLIIHLVNYNKNIHRLQILYINKRTNEMYNSNICHLMRI
jgi:hypothetical protein